MGGPGGGRLWWEICHQPADRYANRTPDGHVYLHREPEFPAGFAHGIADGDGGDSEMVRYYGRKY